MPRGGDRVGALVIGDLVGKQRVAVLDDLDMPLSDDKRELILVLDLIRLKDDRRVPRPLAGSGGSAELRACRQP